MTEISGSDVNKILEDKEIYDSQVKKLEIENNNKANVIQGIVYKNSNPSPIIIAIIIIIIFIVIWFLYTILLKPVLSGKWLSNNKNIWMMQHNIFNNNVCVRIYNGKKLIERGSAYFNDNIFKYGNKIGIWNYSDNIILLDGEGNLQRIK